ncbi:MAG: BsaA family SipW-dependent biofilm matrix protein [Eubacteriaceae bacterium]
MKKINDFFKKTLIIEGQAIKILPLSVVLLGLLVVGTLALFNLDFIAENLFNVGGLKVGLEEEFEPPVNWQGEKVPKVVTLFNKGVSDVILRVRYTETWESGGGLLSNTDNGVGNPEVVTKNWTTGTGLTGAGVPWIQDNSTNGDGWYYYKKVLKAPKPGALLPSQVTILDSIQANPLATGAVREDPLGSGIFVFESPYNGAGYNLAFHYEFLLVNEKDAQGFWGVKNMTVNEGGDITWNFPGTTP